MAVDVGDYLALSGGTHVALPRFGGRLRLGLDAKSRRCRQSIGKVDRSVEGLPETTRRSRSVVNHVALHHRAEADFRTISRLARSPGSRDAGRGDGNSLRRTAAISSLDMPSGRSRIDPSGSRTLGII
jgi:hypothetical protein